MAAKYQESRALKEDSESRSPRTILFDLDGTLIDTLPLIYHAFNAALAPMIGERLSEQRIRALFGPPDNDIIRNLVTDPEDQNAAFNRYVSCYREEHDELATVFDGIPELLDALTRSGVRLAIVTGKSRITALESLERTGLAGYFDVVLAGDDVEKQKPDPEALFRALEAVGHGAGEVGVMVGDSAADVTAGRMADLMTVGVLWGVPEHDQLLAEEPDHVVEDVSALYDLLGVRSTDEH